MQYAYHNGTYMAHACEMHVPFCNTHVTCMPFCNIYMYLVFEREDPRGTQSTIGHKNSLATFLLRDREIDRE